MVDRPSVIAARCREGIVTSIPCGVVYGPWRVINQPTNHALLGAAIQGACVLSKTIASCVWGRSVTVLPTVPSRRARKQGDRNVSGTAGADPRTGGAERVPDSLRDA
ncbi:hypothetical protein R69746_07322 [Paraburkholderia aspalathi]|nr:hypothetical protein R69746_07322 [Paraburkholderia aspalathi]CAE6863630.1 hypothetical protein R75465_07807 [Paraburkholderia aspalathi]